MAAIVKVALEHAEQAGEGEELSVEQVVEKYTEALLAIQAESPQADVTVYQIKDGECGQFALDEKYVKYATKFDSNLKEGTCASQGYTVADGTQTIKVPILGDITVDKFKKPSGVESPQADVTVYQIKDGECG